MAAAKHPVGLEQVPVNKVKPLPKNKARRVTKKITTGLVCFQHPIDT